MAEWETVMETARFPENGEIKNLRISRAVEIINGKRNTDAVVITMSEGKDKRISFGLSVGELLSLSEIAKNLAHEMIDSGKLILRRDKQ